jgi:hypothetical protein
MTIDSTIILDSTSCYVRAAYCDGGKDKNDLNNWKVVVSERIEGAINLGDTGIRSLKGAGVPEGASVQVGTSHIARRINYSKSLTIYVDIHNSSSLSW